ncbi:AsmA family protein [Psychromonas sp. 14N.309.X.WAT.B.A12]|uniref:AsmA family protein n=1 Tax=unclassified Psychromonas TaxID=2614957 RepID=UPI0025B0A2BB|nr:AsmA family protein [Psychromonas sp. 14N.309.X.WAT.B.A12]MDN2662597.1 AsmA family protein [Psychromonas sp. 14N.309.X.WAT.B.A12]
MKLFLKLALAVLLLLVAAIVIVVATVDPNDYKQQIQDQAKNAIDRDLVITGDLGWSLYPLLGFKSGQVTLQNSPEFEEKTLLNIQEAAVSINILPLFSGNLEIGEIVLDGVEFNLITNKDGTTNLDDLTADTSEETATDTVDQKSTETTDEEASSSLDLSKFVLSGINITNATLKVIDHQTDETQEVAINSLQLEEFAFGQVAHFSLNSSVKNSQVEADIDVNADVFVDADLTTVELTNLTIESDILSDALSGSKLNMIFTSGLKYQPETQELDIQAITINNTFTGDFLAGTIYINSSDINVVEHNQVNLGKLTLTSSLNGSALQNNQVNSTLETNLALDIAKKTAKIDTFKVNNSVKGNDVEGEMNFSLQELTVSDFQKILIKQFTIDSEMVVAAIGENKINSDISTDISYDLDQQKLSLTSLKTKVDDIELNGEVSFVQQAVPVIRYNLNGNVWNLNPYLPEATENANSEQETTTTSEEVEPDLSILNDLDIKGSLTIAGILYQDITIGKITNGLTVKNGKATINPLTANLYDGSLTVNASVDEDGGKNSYQATTTLKNVALLPLLKDAAEVDLLSGTANFNLAASGQGLTSTKIQQGVNAKGDFKVLDGELYGINLPYEIRVFKAKLTGKTIDEDKLVKKTDFASLTGEFTVDDGIANNQKLTMTSPVIRLDGAGTADTIKQTIDYKLGVTPLSKTDESTSYADLSGVSIPLRIQGSFSDPSFSLDTEGALKEQLEAAKTAVKDKAKEALKDTTKDILSGEKVSTDDLKEEAKDLKNKLKGLF